MPLELGDQPRPFRHRQLECGMGGGAQNGTPAGSAASRENLIEERRNCLIHSCLRLCIYHHFDAR